MQYLSARNNSHLEVQAEMSKTIGVILWGALVVGYICISLESFTCCQLEGEGTGKSNLCLKEHER